MVSRTVRFFGSSSTRRMLILSSGKASAGGVAPSPAFFSTWASFRVMVHFSTFPGASPPLGRGGKLPDLPVGIGKSGSLPPRLGNIRLPEQPHPHEGEQLVRVDRLGDVVGGAGVQALLAVP